MDEEMILKINFCTKSWIDGKDDSINICDTEKERLRNIKRGIPCIVANGDKFPEIWMYAVFPDCKEVSLSDDIYPNIVEMANLLKDIDGISKDVSVRLEGFKLNETIQGAIIEVLKLLIPQYKYHY
jgi:hypothetical protein